MLPGGRGEEFLIIAAIALIVVGPKDLPKMLREVGRFVGRMRRMADEFRASFEDMARQSELDELRKEVEAMRAGNTPAVFSDLHSEIKSIESDVQGYIAPPHNAATTSDIMTPIETPADPKLSNPQLDGLPPVTPSAPQPPNDAPKKPRVRKQVVKLEAAPAPEPTVQPAKRAPRRKVTS